LCRQLLVVIRADDQIGGASSRLQAALRHAAGTIGDIGLAGRELDAEQQAGAGRLLQIAQHRQLVAPDHANIAKLGEIPSLRYLFATMVMYV
jgi:hypothetical protein